MLPCQVRIGAMQSRIIRGVFSFILVWEVHLWGYYNRNIFTIALLLIKWQSMKQTKHILIFIFILSLGCKSEQEYNTRSITKLKDSDRFAETMIGSHFYKLNAGEDNVIETKKGNMMIIPSGSLLSKNGKTIEDSIQIEFAEGNEIDEIILSNLMIQDSAKIYESYLSFFINATRNGEQLQINPDNPIYFEVTADKQVSLYKGTRDHLGSVKWKEDKKPVDYLIPVSLDVLDFYPEGFQREVEKGLPFRNHKIVTDEFLDSLYYSYATELDELGYYNWNSRYLMINLFAPTLNLLAQEDNLAYEVASDAVTTSEQSFCGINPASIKAIRSRKFQNTLISTREFEYRLRTIFATCDNSILELYVNNLDKNLWEIDEMAAKQLGSSNSAYQKFIEFASYKQTTVKLSDKKAEMLAKYYKKSKEKIEKDLFRYKNEYIKERRNIEQVAQEKRDEYRELLEARQKYRMKKFGFEITNFGWYNAAREIKLSEVEKFSLNITVENGDQYDRVYSYVVNPGIKSIFSYLSDDKRTFDIVFSEDPNLLLWKNQLFNVISVGYQADKIGYKIKECKQMPVVNVDLALENNDYKTFRNDIREFSSGYKRENKILIDLEYQSFFYKEKLRKERENEEREFIDRIRSVVFPCCFDNNILLKSFEFRNTRLIDVLTTIERKFNVSIHLENRQMKNEKLTASFKESDIDEVIDVICKVYDLDYQYSGNGIRIF